MTVARKVCIVGAGPAGFYAAKHIVKNLARADVDIFERLPVPFGLVRFGVAPDHPEVKNVINSFTKVAQNERVNFYGNVSLGRDVSLAQLRQNYHAVLLAYGADRERSLGVPNERVEDALSARDFVGWYNGSPDARNLRVRLCGPSVAIVGQGNVAMDVARILLAPIDALRKTDITERALAALADSKVKNVHVIGRRGPLQAAFTIKELREIVNLPGCETIWRESDFDGLRALVDRLPRPKRRIVELMLESSSRAGRGRDGVDRRCLPIFYRSPRRFLASDTGRLVGIELAVNRLAGENSPSQTCVETEQNEILNCDLILKSIGYKSVRVDPDINFDRDRGFVENRSGRMSSKSVDGGVRIEDCLIEPGVYVTGWLRTGPRGVILDTMADAFSVAANLCNDFNDERNFLNCDSSKEGFDGIERILKDKNVQIVTWSDWEKIDRSEIEAGKKLGKPREKICNIEDMLKVCS